MTDSVVIDRAYAATESDDLVNWDRFYVNGEIGHGRLCQPVA
jgi:hypothetical protein